MTSKHPPRGAMSVPDAGAIFLGMFRGQSYAAARRGEIATIRVGKHLWVPAEEVNRLRRVYLKLVKDAEVAWRPNDDR